MTEELWNGTREEVKAEGILTKEEFNDIFKLLKMFCGKTGIRTENISRMWINIDGENDEEFYFDYNPEKIKSKKISIRTKESGPIGLDEFVSERNGNL